MAGGEWRSGAAEDATAPRDGRAECFVCTEEDAPLLRVCKCNMRVHRHCLQTLVNRVPAHAQRCPLCRHPYDMDVTVRRVLRIRDALTFWYYAIAVFCLAVLVAWLGLGSPPWMDFVPHMFIPLTPCVWLMAVIVHAWGHTVRGRPLLCASYRREVVWRTLRTPPASP